MIMARILADLIVVVHACFVAFVGFGMVAILLGVAFGWGWVRNFWFRTAHLAAIGVVAALALGGVNCPLTTLENYLRRQAGQATYPGAFIGYWVHRLIFFHAEPWILTLGYSLFGLAVLAAFILAPPRWPRRAEAGQVLERVRR
jgi:hypothetical protein